MVKHRSAKEYCEDIYWEGYREGTHSMPPLPACWYVKGVHDEEVAISYMEGWDAGVQHVKDLKAAALKEFGDRPHAMARLFKKLFDEYKEKENK